MASVRRCIDCDVVLSDDPTPVAATDDGAGAGGADGGGGVPVGEGDRVGYELDGWGNQLKVSLEGMLDQAGIRRVWEAGALVVSADDEEAVDALIATVEGRDVVDVAELDEQVAFEIEDLDPDTAAELDAQLIARGLAHAWSEEGELLVAAADEDEVSELIDALLDVLAEEGAVDGVGDGDGLAANEALSDLFLVLDRLVPAPHDAKLAERLASVTATVTSLPVPYGFGAGEWAALHADLGALLALLDADPALDEDLAEDAVAEDPGEGDDDRDDDEDEPRTWADRISRAAAEIRDRVHGWI